MVCLKQVNFFRNVIHRLAECAGLPHIQDLLVFVKDEEPGVNGLGQLVDGRVIKVNVNAVQEAHADLIRNDNKLSADEISVAALVDNQTPISGNSQVVVFLHVSLHSKFLIFSWSLAGK